MSQRNKKITICLCCVCILIICLFFRFFVFLVFLFFLFFYFVFMFQIHKKTKNNVEIGNPATIFVALKFIYFKHGRHWSGTQKYCWMFVVFENHRDGRCLFPQCNGKLKSIVEYLAIQNKSTIKRLHGQFALFCTYLPVSTCCQKKKKRPLLVLVDIGINEKPNEKSYTILNEQSNELTQLHLHDNCSTVNKFHKIE